MITKTFSLKQALLFSFNIYKKYLKEILKIAFFFICLFFALSLLYDFLFNVKLSLITATDVLNWFTFPKIIGWMCLNLILLFFYYYFWVNVSCLIYNGQPLIWKPFLNVARIYNFALANIWFWIRLFIWSLFIFIVSAIVLTLLIAITAFLIKNKQFSHVDPYEFGRASANLGCTIAKIISKVAGILFAIKNYFASYFIADDRVTSFLSDANCAKMLTKGAKIKLSALVIFNFMITIGNLLLSCYVEFNFFWPLYMPFLILTNVHVYKQLRSMDEIC